MRKIKWKNRETNLLYSYLEVAKTVSKTWTTKQFEQQGEKGIRYYHTIL